MWRPRAVLQDTANGLASGVLLQARFTVVPGWKEQLELKITWTIVGVDGHRLAQIETLEAEPTDEVAPDKADPRYQGNLGAVRRAKRANSLSGIARSWLSRAGKADGAKLTLLPSRSASTRSMLSWFLGRGCERTAT
jgi:hypothetical protein